VPAKAEEEEEKKWCDPAVDTGGVYHEEWARLFWYISDDTRLRPCSYTDGK
jgi:hypothetical protein